MMRNRTLEAITLALSLALAAGIAGCNVHVDKGANGEDKNVQVDTPFGGVHVNTDQTTAADLGLPVYPGAQTVKGDDKNKSADVQLGFGEWQLRVRAVSYATADTKEQVIAYYKKALGRFGNVIVCQDNAPVGTPKTTSEGLSCEEKNTNVKVDQGDYSVGKGGLELKAGSRRHQHIVGFEEPKDGKTRFALVALDLPTGLDNDSNKSD